MKDHKQCSVCLSTFPGRKMWIRHLETCHTSLSVKCPFCMKTFKRTRDFDTHCQRAHAAITYPKEAFKHQVLFNLSLNKEDFSSVYAPDRTHPASIWWSSKMSSNQLQTSTMPPPAPVTSCTGDNQNFSLNHVCLTPGILSAEGEIGFQKFSVSISDKLFSDPISMRSLSRKMAALPLRHQHDRHLDTLPSSDDEDIIITISNNLGVNRSLIDKLFTADIYFSGAATPLQDERTYHDNFHVVPECNVSSTPVLSPVPVPTSSLPVHVPLAPVFATAPASAFSAPAVVPAIAPVPAFSAPVVEPVSVSVFTSSQIPTAPSEEYRANKLIRMGALPLFPPARRSWDKDEVISISLGSESVTWPPKNWKSLTPDQRLLQVEFLTMRILKSRGKDISSIDRCHLLNQFNFLVLPGSLSPKCPKHDTQLRSCHSIYHQLSQIATAKSKNSLWLTMIESSSMFRDTSNDRLIKLCDPIPLRL